MKTFRINSMDPAKFGPRPGRPTKTRWPAVKLRVLRQRRLALGHSLAGVAKVLGVSRNAVWSYETGRMKPDSMHFEKYCRLLKLSTSEKRILAAYL